MVAYPPLSDAEIDRVFHALADATRRDIVTRVMSGEAASISALAARYEMSFAAVQKHVAVLEGAGLALGRRRVAVRAPAADRAETIAEVRRLPAYLPYHHVIVAQISLQKGEVEEGLTRSATRTMDSCTSAQRTESTPG